ncbi:hypothetical protein Q8A67_004521 [Cirrhinus molitorella]|uniref:Immunoglobulin V-set domain-containing protein n=1 Tax=Cirrhinus molitorella TaxID=172907 RepID=A0AA88Q2G4_9TELE|nr:hypothetical protein Q8A67_004521 [Cirrhinus molitorella]
MRPGKATIPTGSKKDQEIIITISGDSTSTDLGLYYCAEREKKVNQDEKGILSRSEVYYYGSRTTRLSLEVTSCSEPLNTTSTPPCVSDCLLCWTLLFSVCPACFLLSSICVFCLCCKKTTDAVTDQKDKLKGRNTAECADEEVCYASLDVIAKRQKQRKTKRVQSSDFSTYVQVNSMEKHQSEMNSWEKESGRAREAGSRSEERCPRAQKNETHILAVGTFRLVERSFGVGGAQAQSALTLQGTGPSAESRSGEAEAEQEVFVVRCESLFNGAPSEEPSRRACEKACLERRSEVRR